jgi:thiamine-monophosphate kinase
MKVSKMGEFGLIDLLDRMIADAKINESAPDLTIGIGDDAAAWRCGAAIQLATTDAMVQGVHFSPDTATWQEVGWKSLTINLSDIAAMGGIPQYALVALNLPEDTEVADVARLYKGMIDCARQFKLAIVGGNISRASQISITVTVIGSGLKEGILRRSSARPGDTIAITGYLGNAAAGLEMFTKKLKFKPKATAYFRNAFLHPLPRIAEGQTLVKHGIKTAIDTSDGLLSDLRHICEASKVSARVDIDSLPIHEMLRENFQEKAAEMALSGGEDYELLFTGSAAVIKKVKKELTCPVTVIGEITAGKAGKISLRDAHGNPVKIGRTGWRHF